MAAVRTQTCQRHTAALGTLCSEFFLLRFYLSVLGGILLPDIVSRHIPTSSLQHPLKDLVGPVQLRHRQDHVDDPPATIHVMDMLLVHMDTDDCLVTGQVL